MELSAGESGRTEHLLSRISLSGGDDRRTDPRKGVFRMLDYEEELKKFHPSLEVEQVEENVYKNKPKDMADLLDEMLKENEGRQPFLEEEPMRCIKMWSGTDRSRLLQLLRDGNSDI